MVLENRSEPKPGQTYTHYKGNAYNVIGIGRLEASPDKRMVIYKSETDEDSWLRPIDDFMALIEIDGKTIPRFTLV